jgi:hypothetical protein
MIYDLIVVIRFLEFSKRLEKTANFLVFLRGAVEGCAGGYWVKHSVQA